MATSPRTGNKAVAAAYGSSKRRSVKGGACRLPAGSPGGGRWAPCGASGERAVAKQKVAGKNSRLKEVANTSRPVKLTQAEHRAFDRSKAPDSYPAKYKDKLSKDATGKLGERIIVQWMHNQGMKDAVQINKKKAVGKAGNNYSIDLAQNYTIIEAKAGVVNSSNTKWSFSIGGIGAAKQERLKAMTPEKKAMHNQQEHRRIMKRKREAQKLMSNKFGKPFKTRVYTMHIDPVKKIVDIYAFEGLHRTISWKAPIVPTAYVGSYNYSE